MGLLSQLMNSHARIHVKLIGKLPGKKSDAHYQEKASEKQHPPFIRYSAHVDVPEFRLSGIKLRISTLGWALKSR